MICSQMVVPITGHQLIRAMNRKLKVLRITHAAIDTAAAQGHLSHEERREVTDEIVAFGAWNRRAQDATETAALRKVRDEMAVIRMKFPGWEPESLKVQPAMVPVGVLHDWLAALDAILKERE